MKHYITYLLLSVTLWTNIFSEEKHHPDPHALEGTINNTIQSLLESISDPLSIQDIGVNFNPGNILSAPIGPFLADGYVAFSNITVKGLRSLQVPDLNFAIVGMRLNFTVGLPVFDIEIGYDTDMTILTVLPIYGRGTIRLHFEDLTVMGSTQVNLTEGAQLKNFRLQVDLEKIGLEISGLLNSEEFSAQVNNILSQALDFLPLLFHTYKAQIADFASPLLEGLINGFLQQSGTVIKFP